MRESSIASVHGKMRAKTYGRLDGPTGSSRAEYCGFARDFNSSIVGLLSSPPQHAALRSDPLNIIWEYGLGRRCTESSGLLAG
jgi:hypothetical protein